MNTIIAYTSPILDIDFARNTNTAQLPGRHYLNTLKQCYSFRLCLPPCLVDYVCLPV